MPVSIITNATAIPTGVSAKLTLRRNYDKLLDYIELLSQISGDMNSSIKTAFDNTLGGLPGDEYSSDSLAPVISALSDNLYAKHNALKVSVSSIAAISDIINSSCDNFSSAIAAAAKELSNVPAATKNDCLNSLTPEVASSVALKNKFEYGIREPLEESLTIYDVSAAAWFYESNKANFSTLKQCIIFGLPSGFSSLLARQEIAVENDDGVFVTETLPERREVSKMTVNVSARSMIRSADPVTSKALGSFNPYVHAYVNSSIEKSSELLKLVESGSIKLMCYDKLSGAWIDTTYGDCMLFLQNGGSFGVSTYSYLSPPISAIDSQNVIFFHALDAILKSTIRATCGLEFRENTLSSSERTIAPASAASLIDLLGGSSITPRGGLTASQFLNLNSDGSYAVIPYSGLSGEASNSTDPSTHGLLLKILNSGVFTSETSLQRILSPDPFERIYCVMYDPDDLTYVSGTTDATISTASLLSIGITAE